MSQTDQGDTATPAVRTGRLVGRFAIITGASRGIGLATAEALASEGAGVMLLARSSDEITALAGRLRRSGARAEAMTCDVAEYSQMQAAVARTRDVFGRIDILVNNAGLIDPIAPLHTTDPVTWAHAADVNYKGVFFGIRSVLPIMRAQQGGVIINLGSGAAHNPLEGWSQYCSAKAAVAMLTRCVHLENRGRGIRVFGLSPGTVATDMQRRIKASGINPVSQIDFASHAPVEQPARAIVWLCTDEAADLAGEEISLRNPAHRTRIGL